MRSLAALFLVMTVVAGACGDTPPAASPSAVSSSGAGSGSGGAGSSQPQGSPACGGAAGAAVALGVLAKHVPVFGRNRSYTLVVPASYTSNVSLPLVYVLHGNGGNGAGVRAAFDLESQAGAAQGGSAAKAIFAYPNAVGGGWDLDSETSKNPDVAFFDAILAVTQSTYCVDLHRVFIAGFSNGAYMANQLACRRGGDRIRGVATASGGGPYEAGAGAQYDDQGHLVCGGGKPVASLVIHGTADGTVAPSEGQKSIDHWTFANHCSGGAASGAAGCIAFQGCANPVSSCKVQGLGHAIAPQMKSVVWSFFDGLR